MSLKYTILGVLSFFVVILGLGFAIQGTDFFLYRTFAPKYEATRRQVYEQSKSYNEGMLQELRDYQVQYLREKDPQAKQAIAFAILHNADEYDIDKLPEDLREFVVQLREERMKGN